MKIRNHEDIIKICFNMLSLWRRDLLEKQMAPQLVKKFPGFIEPETYIALIHLYILSIN